MRNRNAKKEIAKTHIVIFINYRLHNILALPHTKKFGNKTAVLFFPFLVLDFYCLCPKIAVVRRLDNILKFILYIHT